MRLVISLDGDLFLREGERPDASTQRWHVRRVADVLAPIVRDHDVVICHGNSAEISTLALESENDDSLTRPFPLDVLAAQTQGMIGYWLVQELGRSGAGRPVTALITQTVIDPALHVTRRAFVGPPYTRQQIQLWAGELGWEFASDNGQWRRVVPILEPQSIVELPTVTALLSIGTCIVCGGGGVPVHDASENDLLSIDAVVDADLTAARFAVDLDADRLLMLINDFDAETLKAPGPNLSSGSIHAARRFVDTTGRPAAVGTIGMAGDMIAGHRGRHLVVEPDERPLQGKASPITQGLRQ